MPEISRFYGIVIRMYFRDHLPPHFHAVYGTDEAQITIRPLGVMRGRIPPRALTLVLLWASRHADELMDNWGRVQRREAPAAIAELE